MKAICSYEGVVLLSVAWLQTEQERVGLVVKPAESDNAAAVADAARLHEGPAGIRRYQIVQVLHAVGLVPDKGVEVVAGIIRLPDHKPRVRDRHGETLSAKRAQIVGLGINRLFGAVRKAWLTPEGRVEYPTTCPRSLIAVAQLSPPPRVPRSSAGVSGRMP